MTAICTPLARWVVASWLCILSALSVTAQSPADTLAWTKLYDRANTYEYTNIDSFSILAQEARNLAWKKEYDKGKARTYLMLGRLYAFSLPKPALALTYFDSAEVLIRKYNLPHQGDLLIGKAAAHEQLGRYGTAANELLQMVRLMETPPVDTIGLMSSLSNMSQLATAQRDFDGAKRYARRALTLSEASQDYQRVNILNGLFNIYHIEGKQDSALRYMEILYPFAKKENNPMYMLIIEDNFGALLEKMGKPEAARQHLDEALRLSADFPQLSYRIGILTNLGRTYLTRASNDPPKGLVYAKQAEALIDSLAPDNWQLHSNLFETMAFLYRDAGNYQQAMHYMERAYAAADSLFQTEQLHKVAIERENYEVSKRDAQISALAAEQAVSNTQRNWGIAVALLLLVFAGFALFAVQRLRLFNRQLASLNATKDRIMSILSHDLRLPLGTLNSFLQLTRDTELPPAQRERAEQQLSSQLQSTTVMLNNLLQWSLTQVKGKTVAPAALSAKETIEHAIDPLLALAETKSLALHIDVADTLRLYADREMAVFIVRNIFSNAVKFSPIGAAVAISATAVENALHIRIRDEGRGMDAQKLATLFSLENNTSSTGTAKEKGIGIGLPLAADMARQNGGSLTASSTVGKGSEFVLVLPCVA